MVVVEVRQGAGGEETRRGDEERRRGEEEEEQATDIKSNNPHLAGGELVISQPVIPTMVGKPEIFSHHLSIIFPANLY